MNEFEIILLVLALVTAYIARELPRAWVWIFAAFLSFAASAIYWRLGLPHHPAFTAFCDSSICLAVYFVGKERWEMRLYKVFQFSVLVSLIKLGGFIPEGALYPAALEILNVVALLVIGGTAILAGASDERHTFGHRRRPVHRAMHPLRAARATPPFHKVPH